MKRPKKAGLQGTKNRRISFNKVVKRDDGMHTKLSPMAKEDDDDEHLDAPRNKYLNGLEILEKKSKAARTRLCLKGVYPTTSRSIR